MIPAFPVQILTHRCAMFLPSFSRLPMWWKETSCRKSSAPPESVSPQLAWSGLPEGTKSLAVTCFDPDAPTASGFWHWAAFNIPVEVSELPTNAGAAEDLGIDGVISLRNDSGERTYYGANPPAGHAPHRYLYAVHAVDVEKLDIDPDASPTVLGFNLHFHALGRAILWGWYEAK